MADNKRDLHIKFDELIDRVRYKYDDGTIKILNGIKQVLNRCDICETNYDLINDSIDDLSYELSKTSQNHVFNSLQNFFDFISHFEGMERPLKRKEIFSGKSDQPCSSKRLRSHDGSESSEEDDANEEVSRENRVDALVNGSKQSVNGGLNGVDCDRLNASSILDGDNKNGDNHDDADKPCTSASLHDSHQNGDNHDDADIPCTLASLLDVHENGDSHCDADRPCTSASLVEVCENGSNHRDVDKPCSSSSFFENGHNHDDDEDDGHFRLVLSEDDESEKNEVENDDTCSTFDSQERAEYVKQLSEDDKGRLRRIEKLHDTLSMLATKINEFENSELTLDDLDDENSNYVIESKLKERYMQIWNKLYELSRLYPHLIDLEVKKSLLTPYWKKIKYEGCRDPEMNESICKFLHENRDFPDYSEIFEVICETNTRANLNKSDAELGKIAESAFKEIGHEIQKRRKDDDRLILLSRIEKQEDLESDPAVSNKELSEKLEENRKKGEKNLENIINKSVEQQANIKVEIFSESSEEDSESVEDSTNTTLNDNDDDE